jgi:predicted AlkP superfamily pyrophosphatase or phosphodiesterase
VRPFFTLHRAHATLLALTLLISPWIGACQEKVQEPNRPRLVLLIVVDQLRTDFIQRWEHRLRPRGLRYLLREGVFFTDARYLQANTATGPGHATLVTGASPSTHGIIGNSWFDRRSRRVRYVVEDPRYQVLGQERIEGEGTSPRNLLSTTIGDELVMARPDRSRVFSASMKDRSAILLAGHLGKAYWYSTLSGDFVTSTYYEAQYPKWLRDWNRERRVDSYRGKKWRLMRDRETYEFADRDDRPFEIPLLDLGRTMPHLVSADNDQQFYSVLRATPFADRLLLDFVRDLIDAEEIGRRGATDFLAVGFSASDFVGHAFGPSSLEAEDNFLRTDHVLHELFQFIDKRIGLDRTVIALSADHGITEAPEYLTELGFNAGRHVPSEFMARLNRSLKRRFGVTRDLVIDFVSRDLVLDEGLIERLDLDLEAVERATAEEAMKMPGFELAVARADLLAGTVPSTDLYMRVMNGFRPERGGNVTLVPAQGWFLASDPSPSILTAMHGSPWVYDSQVPILIAGKRIKRDVVNGRVAPRDLAMTLASYLEIRPPSGSDGTVLPGVVPLPSRNPLE